jgi:uncharacterized protein
MTSTHLPSPVIETPCIQVCVIDAVTTHCIGCGRTGAEVGQWLSLTPEQRRAVMATLPDRLSQMTTRTVRRERTRQR